MGDYPSAIAMLVDESRVFIDQNSHSAIVLHKTANGGSGSAESVASYFQTNAEMHSTHYIVGQDGHVVQCVLEKDGAGGNCCTEPGYDAFWMPLVAHFGNLNRCTLSIEHFDPSSDNSTPLTDVQKQASFALVKYLCDKYHIPANAVKGHNTIDPINRARCPGNYPIDELMQFLQQPTITAAFQKEVDDSWDSVPFQFQGVVGKLVPKGTGIYHAWVSEWQQGRLHGPPLTFEYHTNDAHGNPIIAQEFAHSRCEWDGQAHWFS